MRGMRLPWSMTLTFALGIAIAALGLIGNRGPASQAFAGDKPAKTAATSLNLPGVCAIEAPGEGFVWKEVNKVQRGGVGGRICVCGKEGSAARINLMILETPIDGDAKRLALLKSQWDGLVTSLERDGFETISGRKPNTQAPIGSRVAFAVTATDPEGQTIHFQAVTIFGAKSVFHFQASAASDENAARLIKTVDTLKEM